jgi:hypothetical protein
MKTIVNRYCYIDTEFYNTKEEYVTPVCCSLCVGGEMKSFVNPQDSSRLAAYLRELHAQGYVFRAYAVEAECRYMQAIGIDPLREGFRFHDLYVLYRLLANRFDEIQYGKHLVDGKVRNLKKPLSKWDKEAQADDDDEDEESSNSQMQYGLASATFKFCNVIRDTDDKDRARERIIAGGPFTDEEIAWIVRYCEDDTKFLPQLAQKMFARYKDTVPDASEAKLEKLSHYSVCTAEMVKLGYPVQQQWLAKIIDNVPYLMLQLQHELIEKSTGLNLSFIPLTWNRKESKFSENQGLIKAHVAENYPHASKTAKGNIQLSEDALENLRVPPSAPKKFIDYFYEYRKFQKTLKSFKPGKGKRGMYDYLGSDGRVRPYFGIFGAQTSRSQPASSGFIFLKSAALRHLVQPKEGKMIVGIDYASQEFLINAILAQDEAMLAAYKSGDPYVFLAKQMGTMPKTGTKDSHKAARKEAKELELGLSYGMGVPGVARRIGVGEERARTLVDLRAGIYQGLTWYRNDLRSTYRDGAVLTLPDGWAHGPDNINDLSMMNFPTQGHGAVVMREAVELSYKENIAVIQTLHDALYAEFDHGDWQGVDRFVCCMLKAFKNVMGPYDIRVDTHAWGPGFPREYPKNDKGDDVYAHVVTPGGNSVSCEGMYWDDKVSAKDRVKWHSFVLDDRFDSM